MKQWASYQIRKIAGCACPGNAGNVSPRHRLQRKPLVSDPGMHHGACVAHVPWCMSGSRTRGGGENVPGIPGACAPAILRIWQEAHGIRRLSNFIRMPPKIQAEKAPPHHHICLRTMQFNECSGKQHVTGKQVYWKPCIQEWNLKVAHVCLWKHGFVL